MAEAATPADESGAYGDRLGDCFGLKARAFVTRTLAKSEIAVTEIRCDVENNGLTAPIPVEDAFLLTLQLRSCARHDLWIDGKAQRTGALQVGTSCIYDLRRNPLVNSVSAFHNLHFYLPRRALNVIAEQDELPPVDELASDPGIGVDDRVIGGLGMSLVPSFDRPGEVTRIFVDHVTTAVASYVAQCYGRRSTRPVQVPGKLSPRQERIAKEMLSASLDGEISISELAAACGLAPGAFRRSFQQSMGALPHVWLLNRRIDCAKSLLRSSGKSLEDIAAESGFTDAGHLARVFSRTFGAPPESFRMV